MPRLKFTSRLLPLSACLATTLLVACGDDSTDAASSDTEGGTDATASASAAETDAPGDTTDASGSDSSGAETPAEPVVRVSASAMTADEIDRFQRAFSYAVDQGWMDAFCDTHGDHGQRHRLGVRAAHVGHALRRLRRAAARPTDTLAT